MCTATEEDQAFRVFTRRVPHGRGYRSALWLDGRIEFDAAGHLHPISQNTKRCPSFEVSPFWDTHQIETAEHWRHKKPKSSIASLRAWRQSRVDQRQRDPTYVRCGSEIGPNL